MNAVDYLLKPFDRARVLEAVERVKARIAAGRAGRSRAAGRQIESQTRRAACACSTVRRAPSRAAHQPSSSCRRRAGCCSSTRRRSASPPSTRASFASSRAHFEGQSKCRTLEELLELLDPARFWRAHRGFVVNIDQIREVMPWFKSSYQLRMNDKQQTEIPVSRAQTKRLRELFNL